MGTLFRLQNLPRPFNCFNCPARLRMGAPRPPGASPPDGGSRVWLLAARACLVLVGALMVGMVVAVQWPRLGPGDAPQPVRQPARLSSAGLAGELTDVRKQLEQARVTGTNTEAELAQARKQLAAARAEAAAAAAGLREELKVAEGQLQQLNATLRAELKQAEGQLQQLNAAQHAHRVAGRIPKILHHIFIPDERNANLTMWPHHERWVANCRLHFSPAAGWEYRLWNATAADALVAEHYPFFLDFYKHNVTLSVEKTDLIRYMVLHTYGGLYLDTDVDCWRDAADTLEGYDVVLQGTHSGEGATNCAIASAPGVPLFRQALDLVQHRTLTTDAWTKTIQRTGPDLLTDCAQWAGVKRHNVTLLFPELTEHEGLVYKVYPSGSWFVPCNWWEKTCRRRTYRELTIGQVDLTRVVGMHRFAGSWIEGKEEGRGIVNTTDELCNPQPDDVRRRRRLQVW